MRFALACALVCTIASCARRPELRVETTPKPEPKPEPEPEPKPEPDPAPDLVVTVSGQRVPIRYALAGLNGGAAVEVVLSDQRLGCEATRDRGIRVERDQRVVIFTLAPLLVEHDGRSAYRRPRARDLRITDAYWPGGTNTGLHGHAEAPPTLGHERTRIALDYDATFPALGGHPASTLGAHGRVDIDACGDAEPSLVRRPQSKIDVRVAGEQIPIAGANLEREGERTLLRLTTSAQSCREVAPADVIVEILYGGRDTSIRLRGKRMPVQIVMANTGFKVTGAAPLVIAGELGLKVVPLVLRGAVDPLRCDPITSRF